MPIAAVVPDIVSLLDQINTPLVPGIQLLIWPLLFLKSILLVKTTRAIFLSLGKAINTPSLFYLIGKVLAYQRV